MINFLTKQILLLSSFVLLFISCSTVENDCVCSQEFRTYKVTVVDDLNHPIDSLTITIKDAGGNVLNVEQDPSSHIPGSYVVLTDAFTQMFCTCEKTDPIYFYATDGNKVTDDVFLFNTDECRCHINKVSGPDTLVLK